MDYKLLAEFYSKSFNIKVSAAFVKRNFKALQDAGWYSEKYTFDTFNTLCTPTAAARAEFIKFCQEHTEPKPKPKLKPKDVKGHELSLAIWYINKIGTTEQARKVLNAACLAFDELRQGVEDS